MGVEECVGEVWRVVVGEGMVKAGMLRATEGVKGRRGRNVGVRVR